MKNVRFSGLAIPWYNIVQYYQEYAYFLLILDEGKMLLFSPDDSKAFLKWLKIHNIPRLDKGNYDIHLPLPKNYRKA